MSALQQDITEVIDLEISDSNSERDYVDDDGRDKYRDQEERDKNKNGKNKPRSQSLAVINSKANNEVVR